MRQPRPRGFWQPFEAQLSQRDLSVLADKCYPSNRLFSALQIPEDLDTQPTARPNKQLVSSQGVFLISYDRLLALVLER